MRTLLLAFLLGWTLAADAAEAWRVGNKLIRVGDDVGRVMTVAGPPDYKEQLETAHGGGAGYRWYYVKTGFNAKTIIVTINRGRVVSIEMENH